VAVERVVRVVGQLGHGLVGIRERVKIYGGEMAAGSANGGGFVLSTRFLLTADRP
jgi:signal transduction histidine kinase